jgi:ATP-binding cassette subfamily B (MDR/TAP) protein 1
MPAILRNEVSWFDQNNSTLLSSRLATDAPLVRTMLVDRVITLFQNLGLIVTAFIITFNLQWKIALVMVGTLPALVLANLCQVSYACMSVCWP